MGGGKEIAGDTVYKAPVKDLVYRTEGEDKPKQTYSDDYTQRLLTDKKKQMDALMEALSRLGMVPQAMPQGMVPRSPYRMPEQEFGF